MLQLESFDTVFLFVSMGIQQYSLSCSSAHAGTIQRQASKEEVDLLYSNATIRHKSPKIKLVQLASLMLSLRSFVGQEQVRAALATVPDLPTFQAEGDQVPDFKGKLICTKSPYIFNP